MTQAQQRESGPPVADWVRSLAALITAHQNIAIMLALGLWVEIVAVLTPGDASWDFLDYHLYNPYALFHGKWAIDIAPAHLQTYFAPTLDIPYYLLVENVRQVWLINAIMEVPHAIAVGLAYLLATRILRSTDIRGRAVAVVATLIGATGIIGVSTAASSLSEMIPVCLVLGGLLMIIPWHAHAKVSSRDVGWAAFLVGAAVGLKLTFISAAIGLGVAVFFLPYSSRASLAGRFAALALGGALGGLLTGGWWWFIAWRHWGSPLFPLFNTVFHSPLVPPGTYRDYSFVPRTLLDEILYPFFLAIGPNRWSGHLFVEYFRDPRLPLALLCEVILLVTMFLHGKRALPDRRLFLLCIFFTVSYAFWEIGFSIIRYLSFLELLTGTIIAATVVKTVEIVSDRRFVLPVLALLFVVLSFVTVNPYWGRSRPSTAAVTSSIPRLPNNAMVILSDSSPLAFLATLEPPAVQFVGATSVVVKVGGQWPMDRRAEAAIRGHKGPMWELERPFLEGTRIADRTLSAYGLRRQDCILLTDNVPWSSTSYIGQDDNKARIRMCKAIRIAAH